MNYSQNPFQELYVADTVSHEHFVRLFSKVPMEQLVEFHQLFQQGNVVLLGSQGCGKTMLLTLLRPEIRIAYARFNETFPVPKEYGTFLGAGINLTKSGIAHLAGVTLGEDRRQDLNELPYFFGDFFNHKVVLDLLDNLDTIAGAPQHFNFSVNLKHESAFVKRLKKEDCWAGALDGCSSFQDLKSKVQNRIACYRKWMGHNVRHKGAPELLRESKSVIGEPILRTVECLKSEGVLQDIPVFIRIDQIEELVHAPSGIASELRLAFRQMLNGALGRRNLNVAYRLGSRPYGWDTPGCLNVFGGGVLEEKRDFLSVDFDAVWKRKENVGGNFEHFAADAFKRRVKYYLHTEAPPDQDLLSAVFSSSAKKSDREKSIFGTQGRGANSYERALAMGDKEEAKLWSKEWRGFLSQLFEREPLEAVLAAAWARQTGGGRGRPEHRSQDPPSATPAPWQNEWWRKERLNLAVLQLSARRGQRLTWWGKTDILELSGGNILAFLGLCHGIWNQFLKSEQAKSKQRPRTDPLGGESIDKKLQAVGIQDASKVWYNKLAEHKPGGDIRQRFISKLGTYLRRVLRDDIRMSYPGANGFSLEVDELESPSELHREAWGFLKQCVGWGALVAIDHTTKEKSGEKRIKFYLHPILSPVFQLPVPHTKEPLYWTMTDLLKILHEADAPFLFLQSGKIPAFDETSKCVNGGGEQLELF